jgi:hypothetical protein
MLIYTHTKSVKKKRKTKKSLALKASWQAILDKYPTKQIVGVLKQEYKLEVPRKTTEYPSLDTGYGLAAKPKDKTYTGDAMIGTSQLHKSNEVPVFRKEDVIDISKMRR